MYLYEGVYATYYDQTSEGLKGDVEFYVEEARSAGSPVLEIGSGTGRILVPVAQAGIEIVGLDLSHAMMEVAREKLAALEPEVRGRVQMVEGDMRDFSLGRRFRLVMIPYRAFLHMMTPDDQRKALLCIREHLEEDGRLIFNVFDPRLDIIAAHMTPTGHALKKLMEFTHPENGRRVIVWDTRHYDPEQQTIEEDRIFEEIDDEGAVISRNHSRLILRYLYRYEMEHLLELCGYKVEALYGDFKRGAFRYGGEQVWVAGRV